VKTNFGEVEIGFLKKKKRATKKNNAICHQQF
jgi:hypothetical protein